MRERIERLLLRFEEIDTLLSDEATISNTERLRDLMKERRRLEEIVEPCRTFREKERELAGLAEMLVGASGDLSLCEMIAEEERALRLHLSSLEEEIKRLLLPRDENDDNNVIMEIRAGAGGEEAALFAADLYRMYTMYAARAGLRVEPISSNPTELGGYREISFMVVGRGAYARLKHESGVHRVQRIPRTESQGRIQTSTVTVAVLPEVEEVKIEINPADIEIETLKSSGAGGQHINKTESAVRLYHRPSGIIVFCQEERSQMKNRDKAMRMLRAKLYEAEEEKRSGALADTRRAQVGTGDRSEKIRTYNFPQSRVTDHRISLTLHRLDSFLNGDLDEVIEALITNEVDARMKAGEYDY